jgi:hypothetical protein
MRCAGINLFFRPHTDGLSAEPLPPLSKQRSIPILPKVRPTGFHVSGRTGTLRNEHEILIAEWREKMKPQKVSDPAAR